MKLYNVTYNQGALIVMVLIFVPLLTVPGFVGMAYIPNLPEWALISMIVAMLGVALLLTLAAVKKISPKGVLTLNDDGFVITFPEKNIFAPRTFEIKIREITNFYSASNEAGDYMGFTTTASPSTFNLSAASKKDEDTEPFRELIMALTDMVNNRNEQVTAPATTPKPASSFASESVSETQPITNISMYQRPWVKVIVIFAGIVFVAMTLISIFGPIANSPSLLRLAGVLLIGLPIVYKVYKANKKKA